MIIYESFYNGYSGITNSAVQMLKALDLAGIEYRIHPLGGLPENHPLIEKVATTQEYFNDDNEIILHQLPTVNPKADSYYSVFEFDIPPVEWWNLLRKSKHLLTQSHFCRNIFNRIPGMDKDIHILPFPADKRFKRSGPNMRNRIRNTTTGKLISDYEFVFGSTFQ